MKHVVSIFKRELMGYFVTPVAYVFLCIFALLVATCTFHPSLGDYYGARQADLRSFFGLHPWLYLLLIPAISMRLWAEERRLGTIELLLTLPVTTTQAVVGKYLAAWAFAGIALALTFPAWITCNYLGDPDNLSIVAGYLGSFLVAGGFLAIGSCLSALTKNQVIAFVLSIVLCLAFTLPGFLVFPDWVPELFSETAASFSFYTHFEAIRKGVVDLRDLIFFASIAAFFLFSNVLILDIKKAD